MHNYDSDTIEELEAVNARYKKALKEEEVYQKENYGSVAEWVTEALYPPKHKPKRSKNSIDPPGTIERHVASILKSYLGKLE